MLKIGEIRQAQVDGYKDTTDEQLLEAYGVVNKVKKEFTSLEKNIKDEAALRFGNKKGFVKPHGIQQTLTFPGGDVYISAVTKETDTYTLDGITLEEFRDLLVAAGLQVDRYISFKLSITNTALANVLREVKDPNITRYIKKETESSLNISTKEMN